MDSNPLPLQLLHKPEVILNQKSREHSRHLKGTEPAVGG